MKSPIMDATLTPYHALALMTQPVTRDVEDYIVCALLAIVDFAIRRTGGRPSEEALRVKEATLSKLVPDVLKRSGIKMPGILVALAYLERAMKFLTFDVDQTDAHEELFFGAAILSEKYVYCKTVNFARWSELSQGLYSALDIHNVVLRFSARLGYDERVTVAEVRNNFPVFKNMFLNECNPRRDSPYHGSSAPRDAPFWWPQRDFRRWYKDVCLWNSAATFYSDIYNPAPLEITVGIPVHKPSRRRTGSIPEY